LGKNKVMTIGLGRDAASEVHQDLHKLSKVSLSLSLSLSLSPSIRLCESLPRC